MHAKLHSLANDHNPTFWVPFCSSRWKSELQNSKTEQSTDIKNTAVFVLFFFFLEHFGLLCKHIDSKQNKLVTIGSECGQRWFIYLWWGVKEDGQGTLSHSWALNVNHEMFYVCPRNYFGSWSLSFWKISQHDEQKREIHSYSVLHVNPTWSI